MGHGIVFSLLIIIGCLSCCEGLLISRISSVDIERVSSFHAYRYRSDSFINLRSYASKQRVSLSMRVDASTASAYFSIGDRVRVKSTVWHYPPSQPKFDSKDLIGSVIGVWDKCEVDPHCCCAELAFDAPVEVRFEGTEYDPTNAHWTGHFSLDEIEKLNNK